MDADPSRSAIVRATRRTRVIDRALHAKRAEAFSSGHAWAGSPGAVTPRGAVETALTTDC
jgi:hypothetical protein